MSNTISRNLIIAALAIAMLNTSCSKRIINLPMDKNKKSKLNFVTTNIRSNNLKGELNVIYKDRLCTLVGVNSEPHSLFANTGFNLKDYPLELRQKLSESQAVLLRPYPAFDVDQNTGDVILPNWLSEFTKVKILTIESGLSDANEILPNLPLQTLVFYRLSKETREAVIKEILSLNHLRYLVYQEMSESDILYLKKQLPDVLILSKIKYESMVNQGLIPFE